MFLERKLLNARSLLQDSDIYFNNDENLNLIINLAELKQNQALEWRVGTVLFSEPQISLVETS